MNRRLTAASLVRRSIRASYGGLVIIAVIAAVVSGAAVAGPRAVGGVLQNDLTYRLSNAGSPVRDLQSSTAVRPFSDDGSPVSVRQTVAALPAKLVSILQNMPPALRAIAAPGRYVGSDEGLAGAGIPSTGPRHPEPHTSYSYTLEANPELRSDAVLVSGNWPGPITSLNTKTPIQLVMTASAAKTVGWKVGQVQKIAELGTQVRQRVILVGTVRPRNPSDDYWQLNQARERAEIRTSVDGDSKMDYATAWLDWASWPKVSDEFDGQTIRTWYPITSAKLQAGQIATLSGDLHRFVSKPYLVGKGNSNIQLRYTTNLSDVLSDYLGRAGAGNAVLTVVQAGPVGTGAALLLLAILSFVDRRRRAIELLRARGAGRLQFGLEVGSQVAAATVPGAVVGAVLAVLSTAGVIGIAPYLVALAVALLPAVFAALAAGAPRTVLGAGGVARPSRWRWVIDALLVLLAALAIVVLLQRGLGGSTSGLGTDPLLAVTPLLITAAGCAIVLRLVPVVLRRLRTVIHRGRGVIGLVGRANSARAGARFLPVFAVLTGLSVSIFAASILTTEQTGIRSAAVNLVGADVSISGPAIPESTIAKLRALPGVANLAEINAAGGGNLVGENQAFAVYTVKASELAAVESVLPANRQLFRALGTTSNGHSVAIGGGFVTKPHAVSRFEASKGPALAIDTILADPPKFVGSSPWLLIDSSAAPKDVHLGHQITSVLIRVAPGTDQVVLARQIIGIAGVGNTVAVADTQVQTLVGAPLVGGLEGITIAAIVLSLLLCVLALTLALVMETRQRISVLGRLRAMGFSRRQATALVGWEIGPMTVLGIVAGVLVGIALPILFLTVVDLSTFIGSNQPPALILDPVFIVVAVVAFAASAVIAVLTASAASARQQPSGILREPGV